MSAAHRESLKLVPETCPSVDKAMDIATTAIKELTVNLRDALVDTIDELFEEQKTVRRLEEELAEAKERIRELEQELEDKV